MLDVVESFENDVTPYVLSNLEECGIPGCSIGVVGRNGLIWSKGFGHIDRKKNRKVDTETLFMIGSLSKAYTVTAYLRAVQKGLVSLDDCLVDYYQDFSWNTRFGEEERKKITFRHLLTHWAGFQHNSKLYNAEGQAISFNEYISEIANSWQKYPVGTRFSYSNVGFDLAAHAIERITESKFEDFMQEEVYKPLGMNRSTVSGAEALAGRNTARGHIGDAQSTDNLILIPQLGAGSQFSCVQDMAKFLQMHFNEGVVNNKQFLSKDLLNEMYSIPYQDPYQLMATGMGIGVIKFRYGGHLQLSFFGDGPGYIGLHQFFPHLGLGWLIQFNQVENVFPFVTELIEKIRTPLFECTLGEMPPDLSIIPALDLPETTTLDPSALRRLEGKYISRMQDIEVKQSSGQLTFSIGGQDVTLTPHSDTQFSCEMFPLVEFRKNSEGRPIIIKLVRPYGDVTLLDFDSGPADEAGSDKQEWEKFMGMYSFDFHNFRMYSTLEIRNGYFYLLSTMNSKEYCLTEWKDGIFFTADGQSVVFVDDRFELPASTWIRDDISVETIQHLVKSNPDDIRVNEISLAEYAEILKRTCRDDEAGIIEKVKQAMTTQE
jgi:CubicO group peptidase (beta-lactamase class C family)